MKTEIKLNGLRNHWSTLAWVEFSNRDYDGKQSIFQACDRTKLPAEILFQLSYLSNVLFFLDAYPE